jgi:hypothetical protein
VYKISVTPNETHVDKEGLAVKPSSGKAALVTAATDIPIGVIVAGQATTGRSTVALPGSIAQVLLAGTVAENALLQTDGNAAFVTNAGSGNRVIFAIARQAGISGDLIEALIISPVYFAS